MVSQSVSTAPSSEKILKHHLVMPLVLAALFVLSVPASAQTRLGLLNADRILRDSPTAQQAQVKLREEFAAREEELAKMGAQLKATQTQLETNALTMPVSERQARERELSEATLAYQRQQRAFNEDLNTRREQLLAGVFDQINRAVKQVAEADKLDIIFRDFVWGNSRNDITDKVIKIMHEAHPDSPASR
jgi:outer membrane protein